MRKMLRIGELAELAGTTPNAVRFYHEAGLLREPRRSESGYRLYDDADLIELGRTLRLRSLGLSIPQIRDILVNLTEEEVLKRALESRFEELSAEMVELRRSGSRTLSGRTTSSDFSMIRRTRMCPYQKRWKSCLKNSWTRRAPSFPSCTSSSASSGLSWELSGGRRGT